MKTIKSILHEIGIVLAHIIGAFVLIWVVKVACFVLSGGTSWG